MARAFVKASSQYLSGSAPVSAVPLTLACWGRVVLPGDGTSRTLVAVRNASAPDDMFLLRCQSNGLITAVDFDGTAIGTALSASSASNGVWAHAAAVFAGASSRTAYLNGVAGTPETTTVATSISSPSLGVGYNWSTPQYMDGDIAEAAVWDVALTADEILALSRRFDPRLIRPQSLVRYYPLVGNDSPEPNRWNVISDLTLTNGPTKAEHAPMIYAA